MARTAQQYPIKLAGLGYLLLFLGCLFGITALIGAIISHTHLHKTVGTIARSHLLLQLTTFWILVVFTACAFTFLNSDIAIGFAVAGFTIWLITLIIGAMTLYRRRAVPFIENV